MSTPKPYDNKGWNLLKAQTPARIGLSKSGVSLQTAELLDLRKAHAAAKDAVLATANKQYVFDELNALGYPVIETSSAALDKETFLLRPDLGRLLSEQSIKTLQELHLQSDKIVLLISPGLSAPAIDQHALPFLKELLPRLNAAGRTPGTMVWVNHGRVAVSDVVGEILQATLTLMLIGERPGLSIPDSMGCYLTYAPRTGLTDDSRNCISNIHPRGLSYAAAAHTAQFLIQQSLEDRCSGVRLKDRSASNYLS